jgi:hypothetical protein
MSVRMCLGRRQECPWRIHELIHLCRLIEVIEEAPKLFVRAEGKQGMRTQGH